MWGLVGQKQSILISYLNFLFVYQIMSMFPELDLTPPHLELLEFIRVEM